MQVQVARIGKPHGIRGEVTVQLFTDDPGSRFAAGAELSVEPASPLAPGGRLTVSTSRWNKSILVVRFREVATRNDAEALRDHRLSVESEEVEEDEEGYYEHELEGLDVFVVEDPEQAELGDPVGRVTGLQTGAAQDLLRLELADGAEVLVPFVEEIVPEVDLDAGRVVVCPPPGLLELNEEQPGADSDVSADSDADAESDAGAGADVEAEADTDAPVDADAATDVALADRGDRP
ncbi:ribosome maturation factor RimM [Rothia sp. AR01]|uniref:Ribosome maturation factor RimM n=1 Tax=Rothia santali TaxID=2949643 RepID=A0A9X2HL95_9MICC|nr:ribosome maturation factor RimM [Rothia santali]MCP3427023.1 ribosome maturation factor RimM [Rothia santali]